MPTNSKVDKKETQKMYDKDVARFAKRIAMAYSSDKIRLVTSRNVRRAVLLHDIDAINDVIRDIPNMPDGFRSDFCDAFIGEDMSGLDLATPAILGYAYRAISARAQNGDKSQQDRLDKLAARIDDLSTDFANSGGMVVRQHEWPLINMSNIANENEDFAIMLDARMVDVDDEKKDEIRANSDYAKKIAQDYDEAWNLDKLRPEDADKLADRCDEIYDVLYSVKIRNSVMQKFAKVKLLDSKDRIIRQFTSGKRGDREKYENYQPGFDILEGSRFESIVELVEHDVAKRYIADVNAKIDKDVIEDEFNETLLTKLYEIYAADQVSRGATETPEQFADQEFLKSFEKMLEPDGDGVVISDNGYNVAIETQTDATIGWVARIRNKVGGDGKKLEKLWKKINRSLEYVDDMADVRMSRAAVERRKKRRNFAGRVLVGFSSSFIASALITVIATATAAKMGLTLASGLALVGGGAALGIMGFQVARWIRNQKKNNLPVSWEEFKKDKQLLRSLGTSGLAIAAMVLGVFGLADAAMGVGIGAALLGAYNNGVGVFKSARDAKMSPIQSIAWAIANAGSVIAGALGGRLGAQWGIGKYNQWNPDNAWFNNKTAVAGEPEKISDEITHERTIMHYSDDMLQNSKNIVEDWYAKDFPNHPEILQQDINAVNQYNIDHDTNLDPYRILHAMKLAQSSRLTYTPGWAHAHNVSQEIISQASNAVGGGTYNSAGIESASYLETHHLGGHGEVGPVGNFTNKTYSPISELPTKTTETVIDQPARYEQTTYDAKPEPVDVRAGYGAFGNYPRRDRAPVKMAGGDKFALFLDRVRDKRLDKKNNLRDRVGSFLDRVRGNRRNESVTENVPPFISNDGREEKLPTFTMDEPQEQQLPPVILDERDKELRITGENTPSPARREFVVPPISSKKLFSKPLFKDIKRPGIEPSRVQEPVQPVQSGLENMTVALTIPEIKKYEPYYDFALTEDQAKRWNTLNKELGTTLAKMRNRSTHADDYMRLRKQANRLTDEINSFTAELGNPSASEIGQALAEIERRKKLKDSIAQYERHMRSKPSGDNVPEWRIQKWESEQAKLVDKIEALGGRDSLDESKLRFATPKPGRLEQKRAEIAQREADRQQQPQRVFKMPMRETQKKMEQNTYKNDVRFIPKSVMEIRGVPVRLVDLTGNGNPVMKNDDHAIVVVDVDGLRIPFFRANGNEIFNNTEEPDLLKQGNWYPVFTLSADGELFIGPTVDYLSKTSYYAKRNVREHNKIRYLNEIAKELNIQIGDMAAYEQIEGKRLVKIVDHQPNQQPNTDTLPLFWAGLGDFSSAPRNVKDFFNSVRSSDYTDEQEKQESRQERDENRRENIEYFRRRFHDNGQRFISGANDLANRTFGRFRDRFFRKNDDSNEYE